MTSQLQNLIAAAGQSQTCVNGRWVPARSINHRCDTFADRIKSAWLVLTGRADAVVWPEG